MTDTLPHARYLGIEVTTAGFAYAVLELPSGHLLDWGLAIARERDAWSRYLERLIRTYAPEVIVHPDVDGARRSERTLTLLASFQRIALKQGIWTVAITKDELQERFPMQKTKHALAVELAERFPELRPRLPRKRKPWQSEDARFRIFQALALILAATNPTPPISANTTSHALHTQRSREGHAHPARHVSPAR